MSFQSIFLNISISKFPKTKLPVYLNSRFPLKIKPYISVFFKKIFFCHLCQLPSIENYHKNFREVEGDTLIKVSLCIKVTIILKRKSFQIKAFKKPRSLWKDCFLLQVCLLSISLNPLWLIIWNCQRILLLPSNLDSDGVYSLKKYILLN